MKPEWHDTSLSCHVTILTVHCHVSGMTWHGWHDMPATSCHCPVTEMSWDVMIFQCYDMVLAWSVPVNYEINSTSYNLPDFSYVDRYMYYDTLPHLLYFQMSIAIVLVHVCQTSLYSQHLMSINIMSVWPTSLECQMNIDMVLLHTFSYWGKPHYCHLMVSSVCITYIAMYHLCSSYWNSYIAVLGVEVV